MTHLPAAGNDVGMHKRRARHLLLLGLAWRLGGISEATQVQDYVPLELRLPRNFAEMQEDFDRPRTACVQAPTSRGVHMSNGGIRYLHSLCGLELPDPVRNARWQ